MTRRSCSLRFPFAAWLLMLGAWSGFALAAPDGGPAGNPAAAVTRIHDLQGSGEAPAEGWFTVEAVVTAVFPELGGFFIQEEDANADADPKTSEGMFVEDAAATVKPGQQVRVEGQVTDTYQLTRFSRGARITVENGGATVPLPAPVTPELPFPDAADGVAYLERFEGMRVTFPGRLYVVDNYHLGQYGEVSVARVSHLFAPTNSIDPNDADPSGTTSEGGSNVAAVRAQLDLNNRSRIVLDDASNIAPPGKIPFLHPANVGGGATLRLGDSVEGLTGILSFDHKAYRIEPTSPVEFQPTNPRPEAPAEVGGNLRVAAANLLNFFTSFGGKEDRGADSAEEFSRQRAKIVAGIRTLNADAVALSECQNNGVGEGSAIQALLGGSGGLNETMQAAGLAPYAVVAPPTSPFGTDVIQVGIIYRPSRLRPIGASLTDTDNPTVYSRPPLAQLFEEKATGKRFWIIANHFKSKGGKGAKGKDQDHGDGQSAYNEQRKQQAKALIGFVQKTLAPVQADVLVIGDLNSYGEEDPIDLFRAAGYVDLLTAKHPDAEPYSFLFDAQVGGLDQALATPSLAARLTGATEWHANADEPHIIDYNFDTDDRQNSPPKPDDEFVANAFRYSDHDPILLGFDF